MTASSGDVGAYISVMDFRVLGPIDVVDGERHIALGGPKQRTVLALLLASAGRRVTIDSLITGVYGEDGSSSSKRSIHTYVSNLRQELGDAIAGHGDAYQLDVESNQIDALRFESDLAEATLLLPDEPEAASTLLRGALAMWRGHAYGDLEGGPILHGEILRLEELRLSALVKRVDADLALGLHQELVPELDALVSEHPYQERFRAQQMLALYRSDRQSDALRCFTRARNFLGEQLGVDPGPDLQRLEQQILDHDPALDLAARTTIEKRAIVVSDLPDGLLNANPSQRDVLMARRERTLQEMLQGDGSAIVELRGTATYVAVAGVADALEVAQALSTVGVSVAIDFGDVEVREGEVSGVPLSRSARLVAAAHPGQVVLSEQAHTALNSTGSAGWAVRSLGTHRLRGIEDPLMVFQATGDDPDITFPPLRLDRLPPPVPGTHPSLGGYELRTLISAHDFGTVYTAYQHSVGREVSVLVFAPELVSDPAFIRRFEAEAHRLARLDHPSIVPVLDYWREPGRAVIVSQLRNQPDLSSILDPEVDQDTIVATIARIGRALHRAHELGVMHGALKPSCVAVDGEGHPAILGLGVAWITEGLSPLTTDAYTGAERLGGQLSPTSDVFSLGAMTAELLSGAPLSADRALPEIPGRIGEVIARAIHPDPSERYPSVGRFVDELLQAHGGSATATPVEELTSARNPYKGLKVFSEVDAPDFYGRDRLTDEMVAAVEVSSLTVVVGPSGIGKSSLVRAGLLPALRQGALSGSQDWLFTDMFPGAHPFAELAAALSRIAPRSLSDEVERLQAGEATLIEVFEKVSGGGTVLFVVDQLEELFTLTDEQERQAFLRALAEVSAAPSPSVKVVATLRADFFDRPLEDPGFGEAIRDRLVPVRALDVAELESAIMRPAESVGVPIDPDLATEMAQDASREPGGLPLLQHSLTELFHDRTRDHLTLTDYRRSGGLVGSIGRRAEAIYLDLPPEARTATREVFLRLVTVDDVSQDTRRRVGRRELEGLSVGRSAVEAVLDGFGRHRLLTFDRDPATRAPTVEVAHESILREWDRLVGWIDAARDDLLTRRRLETAAAEWHHGGEDPSFLLTGTHLENVESWRQRVGLELTEAENDYLVESRRAFDESLARRHRTRRRVVAGLSLGLAAVSVLAVVALAQGRAAQRQATENRLAALIDEAYVAMGDDPNLAMVRAVEAYETSLELGEAPAEVAGLLVRTLNESNLERVIDDGFNLLAMSPDGNTVALQSREDHRVLRLYELASGNLIGERAMPFEILGLAYHPDGSQIAVGLDSGRGGQIVDSSTLETVAELPESVPGFLSYSDDGRFLTGFVSGLSSIVAVWDVEDGYDPTRLDGVSSVPAFLPGSSILVRAVGGSLEFRDAETLAVDKVVGLPGDDYAEIAVHPDGDLVALVDAFADRAVVVSYEQERVVLQPGMATASAGTAFLETVTFTADGKALVLAGTGPVAVAIDLSTLDRTDLGGHGAVVTRMATAGDRLLTQSLDRGLRIWKTDNRLPGDGSIAFGEGGAFLMAIDPTSERAMGVSVYDEGEAAGNLVDLATGETLHREEFRWADWIYPFPSLNPALIAGRLPEGSGVVDMTTGDRLLELQECEVPIAISGPARLVAVRDECGFEVPRSGIVDITTGEMVVRFFSEPLLAGIGEPGTPAADLALTTRGQEVDLWRISTGEHLDNWVPPGGSVDANAIPVGFSQDGGFAYVGYVTGRLVIFDVDALAQGRSLDDAVRLDFQAHPGPLKFAQAAGDFIITSGAGVKVWDSTTGELVLDMPSVIDAAVAITPDGSAVYYSGADGVMRRVPTDTTELAELARSRLLQSLTATECLQYLTEDECSAASS